MNHIMIDLETLGNVHNSVILSIGAVEFSLSTGELGRQFYINVDEMSCREVGLKSTQSTIDWWKTQDPKVFAKLKKGAMPIDQALDKFTTFFNSHAGGGCVWGNSARFDLSILESAYKATNKEIPWRYWNERCLRTIAAFYPGLKRSTPFVGDKHYAIDDCIHQIGYLHKMWSTMKGKE